MRADYRKRWRESKKKMEYSFFLGYTHSQSLSRRDNMNSIKKLFLGKKFLKRILQNNQGEEFA
jgi:hypothetical protein